MNFEKWVGEIIDAALTNMNASDEIWWERQATIHAEMKFDETAELEDGGMPVNLAVMFWTQDYLDGVTVASYPVLTAGQVTENNIRYMTHESVRAIRQLIDQRTPA